MAPFSERVGEHDVQLTRGLHSHYARLRQIARQSSRRLDVVVDSKRSVYRAHIDPLLAYIATNDVFHDRLLGVGCKSWGGLPQRSLASIGGRLGQGVAARFQSTVPEGVGEILGSLYSSRSQIGLNIPPPQRSTN